jgi:hypothetical protein
MNHFLPQWLPTTTQLQQSLATGMGPSVSSSGAQRPSLPVTPSNTTLQRHQRNQRFVDGTAEAKDPDRAFAQNSDSARSEDEEANIPGRGPLKKRKR